MKPKVIHNQAMELSFQAKQALNEGNYALAFTLYTQAARLESEVAEFYFEKPDLEPTRSIIIRSAAFLNIKAGLIENAKKFIFFGLLNSNDTAIKNQLNNALELAVSLDNLPAETASGEFNYINLLRQRSVHYILEPSSAIYGKSVSLGMIREFSDEYLKSLKAFAISKFKKLLIVDKDNLGSIAKEIDKLINPLVTSSAYGSFKFSIANDFLYRDGEEQEILDLKANVVAKYHNEIFINPLSDVDIELIKENYDEEDINDIFRPLSRIKANNTQYKVGYFDSEDFDKKFVSKIINKQRKKLLTVKPISQEVIGELESSIVHKRSFEGKVHQKTIYKKQLRTFEFDLKLNQIEPKEYAPIILNEDILLNVAFNSDKGFTISFEDIGLDHTDIEYEKTLQEFQNLFYKKAVGLANKSDKTEDENRDWDVLKKLLGNPDALKK